MWYTCTIHTTQRRLIISPFLSPSLPPSLSLSLPLSLPCLHSQCVRSVLLNKIISSEKDLVGVVFFGTVSVNTTILKIECSIWRILTLLDILNKHYQKKPQVYQQYVCTVLAFLWQTHSFNTCSIYTINTEHGQIPILLIKHSFPESQSLKDFGL